MKSTNGNRIVTFPSLLLTLAFTQMITDCVRASPYGGTARATIGQQFNIDPLDGFFADASVADSPEGTGYSIRASASARPHPHSLGHFSLHASAAIELQPWCTTSGTATAASESNWSDILLVRSSGEEPLSSLRLFFELTGTNSIRPANLTSPPPFGSARAEGAVVCTTVGDGGFLTRITVGNTGSEISFSEFGKPHIDLTLIPSGPGQYYTSLVASLAATVSSVNFAYDVAAEYSNSFYFTEAYVNGVPIADAGVTLIFESELDRGIPEPAAATLGIMFFAGITSATRRRR